MPGRWQHEKYGLRPEVETLNSGTVKTKCSLSQVIKLNGDILNVF